MYCEKPPVSREVLIEEMRGTSKSRLKKHSHSCVSFDLAPALSEDVMEIICDLFRVFKVMALLCSGTTKRMDSGSYHGGPHGFMEAGEQAIIGHTRSKRVIRTSTTRLEGIKQALSKK